MKQMASLALVRQQIQRLQCRADLLAPLHPLLTGRAQIQPTDEYSNVCDSERSLDAGSRSLITFHRE